MGKNVCSPVKMTSAILTCLVLSLSTQTIAAPPTLIGDSGQRLASVFEGLRATPQIAKYQPLRRPWRGILQSRLPGLLNVDVIFSGDYCPSSRVGNYTMFFSQPGGCTQAGCPAPEDFFIDVDNGDCGIGSMDSPCADGITCCTNAVECDSPNTTGCPTN